MAERTNAIYQKFDKNDSMFRLIGIKSAWNVTKSNKFSPIKWKKIANIKYNRKKPMGFSITMWKIILTSIWRVQHSTHFSWVEIVSEFVSELFWLKEVIFVFCLPMNCITMTNCMPESAVWKFQAAPKFNDSHNQATCLGYTYSRESPHDDDGSPLRKKKTVTTNRWRKRAI